MKRLFFVILLMFAFLGTKEISAQTVCTGDPRLNITDAQNCANIAETQGRLNGLTVSCRPSIVTYPTDNPQAGPGYYFNIPCTVNGDTGYDAVLLAGCSNCALTTPNLNPTWWTITGTQQNTTPSTSTSNNSSEWTSYLNDSERERIQSVYNLYMANSGALLRRTALYYLMTNPGVTSANPYFQVPYFGSGADNLMNRADFRNEVERVNLFWANVQRDYPNREILMEGWSAPLGGDPDRVSRIVWVDPTNLTVRVGNQTTNTNSNNTGSNSNGTSSSSGSINTSYNYLDNARQILNRLIQSNNTSNPYPLDPVFNPNTTNIQNQTNNSTINQNPGTNTGSCYLTRDLRLGDSGPDVLILTNELVKEGLMSLPKNNFDNDVFRAVIAYQEKYTAQILTPVGLSRGTGFVGPSTRNFLNSGISCNTTTTNQNQTPSGNSTPNAQALQAQIRELESIVQTLLERLRNLNSGN
jgi:hypothetical protein